MYEDHGERSSVADERSRTQRPTRSAEYRMPTGAHSTPSWSSQLEVHSACLQRAGRQLLDSGWLLEACPGTSLGEPLPDPRR